jgi:putative DNA primase/helicase
LMRQDFFTFKPTFKLVITGNYKPQLGDVDDALRRRFHVIPFNFKPVAPDTQLEDKLRAEWSAILAWAVEGCVRWHQLQRLQRPEVVSAETEQYFREQNGIEQWIEDNCSRGVQFSGRSSHLFFNWSRWAEQNDYEVGTVMKLSKRLEKLGYRKVAERTGKTFKGIGLRAAIREDGNE